MARGLSLPARRGARMVGRLEELDTLTAEVTDGPRVVLVSGEAGIGKTRLVDEVVERRRARGEHVLVGGCVELSGQPLPYAPLTEALRDPGAGVPAEHSATVLDRLEDSVRSPGDALGLAAVHDGVHDLLAALAGTAPVTFVVEDLHWADQAMLDVLVVIARGRGPGSLLVLGTYRDEDRSPPLRRLVAEVARSRGGGELALPRLRPDEVADLLAGMGRELPHSPRQLVADEIHARSGGNPLIAEELAAVAAPSGHLPTGLSALLLSRMHLLDDDATHVVHTAAVAGVRVPDALLSRACALPPDRQLPALRAAVQAGVLIPDSPGAAYVFRHALTRDAVLAELLPTERRALHEAVARASEADGPPRDAAAAAALAGHWYAANVPDRALAAALTAGRAARAMHAYHEARVHLERALELQDRVAGEHDSIALLIEAADAARWSGEPAAALELIRRALASDPPQAVRPALLERSGRYLWECGDAPASAAAYDEAAAHLAAAAPSALRARVLAAQGAALMLAGRYQDSAVRCAAAIEVARAAQAPAEEGYALNSLGVDLAMLGRVEEGLRSLREALRLAERVGDLEDRVRALANLAFALESTGRLAEAADAALAGLELVRRYALRGAGGVLAANAVAVLTQLGRWQEAQDLADEQLARDPTATGAGHLHLVRAELDVARGRTAAAREHLEAAAGHGGRSAEPWFLASLELCRAELLLAEGDAPQASAAVQSGLAALADGDDVVITARLCGLGIRAHAERAERARALRRSAEALSAEGDAGALLERLEALPGESADVRCELLTARADVTRAAGQADPERWQAAAGAWEALPRPHAAATCRLRAAEGLLARGDTAAAGPLLEAVEASAAALGAEPLLDELRALRGRARLPVPTARPAPDPISPAGELGLTRRERDVLAMLALGSTNRQIARGLFISERTVGVHVSHILDKLAVANRGQAAAVAHRLGLAGRVPKGGS